MSEENIAGLEQPKKTRFDLYRVGLWGSLGILTYFLLTEHLAHVIYFLPLLLLLACPLMHVFMHHGHGGHEDHGKHQGHRP
jgi:hypothetical protein